MENDEDAPMTDLTEDSLTPVKGRNPRTKQFVKGGHVIVAVSKQSQSAELELPSEGKSVDLLTPTSGW